MESQEPAPESAPVGGPICWCLGARAARLDRRRRGPGDGAAESITVTADPAGTIGVLVVDATG
jgi:hypothetical protein